MQKKILAECSGCKLEETANSELETAANPVRMQQLGTGLLTRNPRLTDTQSIPGAEGFVSESDGEVERAPEMSDAREKGFLGKLRERVGR